MKKLFENWRKHINESIGEDTLLKLREVLEVAYGEQLTSYSAKQTVSGVPVDPDRHTEAINTLVRVVTGELEDIRDTESYKLPKKGDAPQ